MRVINGIRHFTFKINQNVPMKREDQPNIPSWIWKKSDKTKRISRGKLLINIKTENSKSAIAQKLVDTFGYGSFTLLAWNEYKKNRAFSTAHRCTKKYCKYYQQKRCTIWSRYKTGWSCLRNPRIKANWQTYARVKIEPSTNKHGFIAIWDPEVDLFKRLLWFMKN